MGSEVAVQPLLRSGVGARRILHFSTWEEGLKHCVDEV